MAQGSERGKTCFMATGPLAYGRSRNRTKICNPFSRKIRFLLVIKVVQAPVFNGLLACFVV